MPFKKNEKKALCFLLIGCTEIYLTGALWMEWKQNFKYIYLAENLKTKIKSVRS